MIWMETNWTFRKTTVFIVNKASFVRWYVVSCIYTVLYKTPRFHSVEKFRAPFSYSAIRRWCLRFLSCTDTTFLYRHYFLVPILLSCTDTTFLYRHHALSQAKLAMERLNIEKIYHPFISGPKNETANQLIKVRVILATLAELRATWQRRSADAACHARIVSSRVPRRCSSFKIKEALRSLPRGLLFSSYCRKDTMALPSGPMSDPSVTVGERIRIGRNLTGKNIMK